MTRALLIFSSVLIAALFLVTAISNADDWNRASTANGRTFRHRNLCVSEEVHEVIYGCGAWHYPLVDGIVRPKVFARFGQCKL